MDSTGLNEFCCPTEVLLPQEEPLTAQQALDIEDLFKVLANSTRLRLLHNLARVKEMCVCDLSASLNMTPQALSNQLQRLHDKGIVSSRRLGNRIYYRVVDHCLISILQSALCLVEDSKQANSTPPDKQANFMPTNP